MADLLSAVARAGGQAAGLLVINPPCGLQVAAGRGRLDRAAAEAAIRAG